MSHVGGLEWFGNHYTGLARGPGRQRIHPTPQVRQLIDFDAGPAMNTHPRPMGDIGNAVITSQILVIPKPGVENRVQPLGLILITLNHGGNLVREIAKEYVGLTLASGRYRPSETLTVHDRRARLAIGRHKLAGFLGEINQNRAGLEDDKVPFVAIDDRRNTPIGIDFEIARLFLLALA